MHAHVQVVKRLYPVFKCSVNMSRGLALTQDSSRIKSTIFKCLHEGNYGQYGVFFSNLMCIVIKITENFLYFHN